MRSYELAEYATLENVPLTSEELTGFREVAPSVNIAPGHGGSGAYDLTPGSRVGAISVGDMSFTIRPKFPMHNVFFLMSYALNRRGWRDEDFDFEEDTLLIDTVARGFLRNVRRSIRRGLLRGYRTQTETLRTIRGQVDFTQLVTRRFTRYPPIDVTYDEYTADIEENQLVRAAIHRLLRLRPRSMSIVAELRALDSAFEEVDLIQYERNRIPDIGFTRLNEHYRSSIKLSRLILQDSSIELAHGHVRASSMLINMNAVFEDFVVTAIREELRLDAQTFRQGQRGTELRLDRNRLIKLEPDLSWWADGRCLFVGDAKYKRTTAAGIKHPDLYQMLAYTVGAQLPSGVIIYARGEADEANHDLENAGKNVIVRTLDLTQSPDRILGQMRDITNLIRGLVAHTHKSGLQAVL